MAPGRQEVHDLRKRPGVVEISFELDDDGELLEQVVEAIFQPIAPKSL